MGFKYIGMQRKANETTKDLICKRKAEKSQLDPASMSNLKTATSYV